MKKILQRILPGLLLAGLLVLPAAAQPRIGIVDLRKVFDNYHAKVEAEITISNSADVLTKDFKARVADFDKLKADYEKLQAARYDQTISTQEKEKRGNAADAKLDQVKAVERSLQEMQAEAGKKIEALRMESLDKILKQIRTVIEAVAKTTGCTLVLDSTSLSLSQAPVVLYTNGENDLTEKVLATLNAASPTALPAPSVNGAVKK